MNNRTEMSESPQRYVARHLGINYLQNRALGFNDVVSERLADKLWIHRSDSFGSDWMKDMEVISVFWRYFRKLDFEHGRI